MRKLNDLRDYYIKVHGQYFESISTKILKLITQNFHPRTEKKTNKIPPELGNPFRRVGEISLTPSCASDLRLTWLLTLLTVNKNTSELQVYCSSTVKIHISMYFRSIDITLCCFRVSKPRIKSSSLILAGLLLTTSPTMYTLTEASVCCFVFSSLCSFNMPKLEHDTPTSY